MSKDNSYMTWGQCSKFVCREGIWRNPCHNSIEGILWMTNVFIYFSHNSHKNHFYWRQHSGESSQRWEHPYPYFSTDFLLKTVTFILSLDFIYYYFRLDVNLSSLRALFISNSSLRGNLRTECVCGLK